MELSLGIVPNWGTEALPRGLNLPIPKRRSPASPHEYPSPMDNGMLGQAAMLQALAPKNFCVVSPSHSSDASTVDEGEERQPITVIERQGFGRQSVADIMAFFSLGQLIGTGSQSFVYICHWSGAPPTPSGCRPGAPNEGPLCIKHIVGDSSREALSTACKVLHPNVARHFATFDDWRGLWVLMEYVRGPDLATYLQQRGGTLSERESKEIFKQLMCALECIHARNLVHQDIKLENVVVRGNLQKGLFPPQQGKQQRVATQAAPPIEIVLVDFGSAELIASQDANPKPESPAGTAMYMAPEIFLESLVDAKCDIWSAAILLCILISGRSPFGGQSILHTLSCRTSVVSDIDGLQEKVALTVHLPGDTEECGHLQEQRRSPSATSAVLRSLYKSSGKASAAGFSPAGAPETVRKLLLEAFLEPEWQNISAEAKDLISVMLAVDTIKRPSAARIRQSTWLKFA